MNRSPPIPLDPRPFGRRAHALHNAWWMLEHLLGEPRLSRSLAGAREAVRARVEQQLRGRRGRVIPVERRYHVDPEELFQDYYLRSRPLVVAGFARSWPACERWSFEWLAEHCGSEPVCVTDHGDPDVVPLAEAIRRIDRGSHRFARFGGLLHHRPDLREDLDLAALARLRPRASWQTSLQFFLAGAGSVTPLHADGTCNFHVQLRGIKVWRIIEPRFNPAMRPIALGAPHFKSPLAPFDDDPEVDVLEAVLEPGDVLFNPSFFWHEVRYRAPSVGFGVRWFTPTSFLRGSPMMALLMVTARRPSVLGALLNARGGRVEGFYR